MQHPPSFVADGRFAHGVQAAHLCVGPVALVRVTVHDVRGTLHA